jgi:hypothetical protein
MNLVDCSTRMHVQGSPNGIQVPPWNAFNKHYWEMFPWSMICWTTIVVLFSCKVLMMFLPWCYFFLQGVTRCPSWPKGTLASTSFFALNEKFNNLKVQILQTHHSIFFIHKHEWYKWQLMHDNRLCYHDKLFSFMQMFLPKPRESFNFMNIVNNRPTCKSY